jgi:hypothetical protein
MAEVEFAGTTFKGGKMFVLLTALSSLGGASWAGFEFYKDYMDMREVVQNIDTSAIEARNDVIETQLQEAIEYTRDIKAGLRDDIMRIEKVSDRTEDNVRELEDKVRQMIDDAEIRFETKREQLRMSQKADLKELEDRLNKKVQLALDNPLAN